MIILRTLLYGFVCFLTLSYVSATEVSISSSINIESLAGEPVCVNVPVSVLGSDALLTEILWSATSERNLANFHYTDEEMGIVSEYPEILWTREENVFLPICLMAETPGKYAGVILVRPSTGIVGVGSWLTFSVESEKERFLYPSFVVGKQTPLSSLVTTEILLGLFFTLVLLLGLLLLLLSLLTRKSIRGYLYR